ncbi:MAG TPA: sigma 54-interacting transcriptional regulator [Verrucomicrobia bacterium]|nr:sigma 54-interacting transcriptional regulator [Verrucomicrobiota bacterium]HOP97013.1 sigma 54-interacting transcriptional regulator [Verrucomicrobiota bacterium]
METVRQTESDSRFDPNFVTQLLLDAAQEHSVDELLRKLVMRAVERPNVVAVQVWLAETAPQARARAEAEGSNGSLDAGDPDEFYLAAHAGVPVPHGDGSPAEEARLGVRIRSGVGLMGRMAQARKQMALHGQQEVERVFGHVEWVREHGVRGFGGAPIMFKEELLGVTGVFVRNEMPSEALPWGQIFANHIGAAIANARAFEEIERLRAQLEQHNAYLEEEVVQARAFGELIGQSAALRQIVSQVDLVAPTDASVLILGETGTGKELVAREIHRRSRRKDGPLVRVNCASIPKDLFESEFFGHVKGAFTGAVKDRAGRFETAEGGTLFLDEIGEVPLDMQGKLLRVLQEKRYERVGDDRTRYADVRIIAATNRNLKELVAAGRFREDLYYRLHVFPIHVAPLRERLDDIPLLARHFVDLSAKELRAPRPRLTRAALAQLQSYNWPGNVRELRNVVERAVILARGGPLQFDLPVTESRPVSTPARAARAKGAAARDFLTEAELRRQERENLLLVLERTGWRIKGAGGAAELLGVKPTTLLSRMKKMGLKRASR